MNTTPKTSRRLTPGTLAVSREDGEPGRIVRVCTFRRNGLDAWSYLVQTAAGRKIWEVGELFVPTQDEKTLPIVEHALANRIAANRAGNIGPETEDGRKADLAVKAAYVALKAHGDMTWLRDKLNEALERVEGAENTKDAHMALVWLRTGLWDDIQAALIKLEAYDDLLR